MKRKILCGIISALLVFMLITCKENNAGNTPVISSPDDNPDLTVPSNPSAIPNFNNYPPISAAKIDDFETELDQLLKDLGSGLSGLVSGLINPSYKSRKASGRAVQSETIDMKFSELNEMTYASIVGYLRGTTTYDDVNDIITANLNSKIRIELYDGFSEEAELANEGIEVIGFITGSATANNVIMTEKGDVTAGSMSGSVNYAVNVAVEDGDSFYWVKLIGAAALSLDASSGEITGTANMKAYGDDPAHLLDITITINISTSKAEIKRIK